MSQIFSFRAPTSEDAGAIAAVYASAFTEIFGHSYPPEELAQFLSERDENCFRTQIESPAEYAFQVAVHEVEGVVGFIKCGLLPHLGPLVDGYVNENRTGFEVCQMYLLKIGRGVGAAQTLMDWAMQLAKDRSFDDIFLTVWIDNHRARRFYERNGFVEVSFPLPILLTSSIQVGKYGYQVGNTIDDDRIMRLRITP